MRWKGMRTQGCAGSGEGEFLVAIQIGILLDHLRPQLLQDVEKNNNSLHARAHP